MANEVESRHWSRKSAANSRHLLAIVDFEVANSRPNELGAIYG